MKQTFEHGQVVRLKVNDTIVFEGKSTDQRRVPKGVIGYVDHQLKPLNMPDDEYVVVHVLGESWAGFGAPEDFWEAVNEDDFEAG